MFLLWQVKFLAERRGPTAADVPWAVGDLTKPQVSEHNSAAQDR